jgi:hypothetical protein
MPSFLVRRLIFTVKERCIRITNFGWKGKYILAYIQPIFVFRQCGKLLPEVAKSVIVVDESSVLLMPSELSKELSNTTLAGTCGRMLVSGEET